MAAKLRKKTKEFLAFANDLFDYVWKKHTFNCEIFEKMFVEKLSLDIELSGAKKGSKFDEHIGNAVICSQYLLREFCCYFFTKIGKDLMKSPQFFHTCVYSVIFQWIRHRNDVFLKVIDSAAIIAEAILFCDAEQNSPWDLNDAPEMFRAFFESQLNTEFFESGGWKKLELQAFSDYKYLVVLLQPFTDSVTLPYEKFKYTYKTIFLLQSSQVQFPVKKCYTCIECLSPLNCEVYYFSYDDSLHAKLKEVAIFKYSTSDELLQKIKNVTTDHIESIFAQDKTDETTSTYYICRIIGNLKVEEASSGKDVETSKEKPVKKSSKKKKSKSKKSKAE